MIQSNSFTLRQQVRTIADVIAQDIPVRNYNTLIVDLDVSGTVLENAYLFAKKDNVTSYHDYSTADNVFPYARLKKTTLVYDVSTTETFRLGVYNQGTAVLSGKVTLTQEAADFFVPERSSAKVLESSSIATHNINDPCGLYENLQLTIGLPFANSIIESVRVFHGSAVVANQITEKQIVKNDNSHIYEYEVKRGSLLIYVIKTLTGDSFSVTRTFSKRSTDNYAQTLNEIKDYLSGVSSTQDFIQTNINEYTSHILSTSEYALLKIKSKQPGTQIKFDKSGNALTYYMLNDKSIRVLPFSTDSDNIIIVKCGLGKFETIINTSPRFNEIEYIPLDKFPTSFGIENSSSKWIQYDLRDFLNGSKWSVKVDSDYESAVGMSSITFESDGTVQKLKTIQEKEFRYFWHSTSVTGYLDLTEVKSLMKCTLVKNANCKEIKYIIKRIDEIPTFNRKIIAQLGNAKILEPIAVNMYAYGETRARVTLEDGNYFLWVSYTAGDNWYKLPFTSTYFENLKSGSILEYVYILPVKTYRTIKNSCRIVVITDRKQVYHNCPDSTDNIREWSELCTFKESALWDLPILEGAHSSYSHNLPNSRFIPSLDSNAVAPYKFFPVLPRGNGYRNDNWYNAVDTSVFPAKREYQINENFKVIYPRFVTGTEYGSNPLMVLRGNMAIKPFLTVLGTYSGTNRHIVWATFDGGREWFASYEFGGANYPVSGFGYEGIDSLPNTITGPAIDTNIADISEALGSGLFSAYLRKENLPTAENKEPVNGWVIGNPIPVTSISKAKPAVVTTSTAHGLQDRDIVFFKKIEENATEFDFLTNPTATENSAGNGVFFYVKVVDETSFKLFWMMSNPDNPLPARHIHSINNTADGFLVSTGEEYTNREGWIMKASIAAEPTDPSTLARYKYDRLNSTTNSISRACGFLIDGSDNSNPDCYFASDSRRIQVPLAIEGRTNLNHIPSGIFKGKFSDIDDFSKWECVCQNPAGVVEYMQQFGRNIIAIGIESIFIFDGERWHEYPIYSGYYKGAHDKGVIINNYEIEF